MSNVKLVFADGQGTVVATGQQTEKGRERGLNMLVKYILQFVLAHS